MPFRYLDTWVALKTKDTKKRHSGKGLFSTDGGSAPRIHIRVKYEAKSAPKPDYGTMKLMNSYR